MSHPRKKGGVRKDKKVARMREDIEKRHEDAAPEGPKTDQHDVVGFKQGGPSDKVNNPQDRGPKP
jgi:hypothetical protein